MFINFVYLNILFIKNLPFQIVECLIYYTYYTYYILGIPLSKSDVDLNYPNNYKN